MEPRERIIVYGLIAACIVGIIIIGFFLSYAGGQIFSKDGFSEVYFEEHQKLSSVINENEPLSFSFSVISHNKIPMDYAYTVYSGDEIVRMGQFILPDARKNNKTVVIDNIRLKSTLFSLNNSVFSETQSTYNGGMGLLISRGESTSQVVTDPSKLYYPVHLSEGGEPVTLIFNPAAHETFQTTTSKILKVGDITSIKRDPKALEINGQQLSNVGFDKSITDWTITNDFGMISSLKKTETITYRYAFKKVSVDVIASPQSNPEEKTYYAINFWIVVKDPRY